MKYDLRRANKSSNHESGVIKTVIVELVGVVGEANAPMTMV